MKYKSIFFDLDGTVTDSSEGIINSIKYAAEKMNYKITEDTNFKKFIGPPLTQSFKKYFGFSEADADKCLDYYREIFVEKGMYQNKLYEGMEDLLKSLKQNGFEVMLATSKPTPQAQGVVDYFDISKYFDFISGSPLSEKGYTKIDVINCAISKSKFEKSEILMVGDTRFDIDGAMACGIDSVAVTFGMGEKEEFENATYIMDSAKELKDFLLNN